MKYPAPVTPNPSKEMEDLVKQIHRYHNGSLKVKEKLSKLKSAHRRVSDSIRRHEILSETSKKDARQAVEKLNDVKQLTDVFESHLHSQGRAFKNDMVALDDLKQGIQAQTAEVWGKTSALQTTCQNWKFADQLNSDVCNNTRSHAFAAFYRWSLIQPLLKIWMSTDSQIHRTTYASAHYEGVYEELMAHFEVKDAIEQFGEDHYAVYRETEDLVHTVKQVQEERQLRSELLDQVHVVAARKLARLVSSCKALQKDIEEREALRFKMNGLMMELSNALDVDLRSALETCEVEATKASSTTVADLHRAVQEGTLVEVVGTKDPFTPTEDGNLFIGSPMKVSESAAKARAEASPRNRAEHSTEANTKLNAVSKLPLIVNSDSRYTTREACASGGNAGPETPTHNTKLSLHDSIYAELPQYDNSAITYVKSFDAPKRTKTWKWCKISAPEVNKSVQTLFPAVRGPVDLVGGPPEEEDVPLGPIADSPKTPSIPAFRRRVGHSSRNPLAGRVISNVNLFSRERVSVGSSGLPPEWRSNQDGTVADGQEGPAGSIAGRAGIIGAQSGSPTESAEEQRKRALKFMLSSRETHYDLMERNVVDAVTLMQMEQARAAAAARRQNERLATASGLLMEGTGEQLLSERDTHQYRTHQLLTEDYTGRVGGESGLHSASEEYSMYVALPDMAAHTSLTARQAVRTMQSASAGITYETVSKISEILEEATVMAKQQSRAGTADVPQRMVFGYGGYGSSPTPPHSPGRQQGQGQEHHERTEFGVPVPSAQASSVPSLLESSLEAQTTTFLDNIPVETQAQDLNERVAGDFHKAREQVEDWIETHTQCQYKATKRSLLELISNLELDLKMPTEGGRETGNHYWSDDDSSVDDAGRSAAQAYAGHPGAAMRVSPERPLSVAAADSTDPTSLKGMLEISKSLIGSIQQNLREFAEKRETSLIPDDISEHRRPNSAGIFSGQRSRSAEAAGGGYYEEDEDESGFDICDYAFNSRPGSAMQQEKGKTATETNDSAASASLSPNARSTAATKKLHAHLLGLGSGGWPTRRTLLTSMESIICGELFVVEFYWLPQRTSTEIIAKSFADKNEYRQCQIAVTPHMISDLTNTPRDLALHTLFHDPAKVTQTIIASLTNETLDDCFYSDIAKAYRQARVQPGGEFAPQWSLLAIEEMLHPRNIPIRRGSISQLYRPSSSEKHSAPNTPETFFSKHQKSPDVLQQIHSGKREYEFLMHILTVRKKSGELLAYGFPSLHTIATAAAGES